MKRIYCLLFILIFMLVQPVTVFANVGMIYSADREGTEFFVDDTHPLIVESEQLTFDVHTRKASHAKALWSDVTAAYTAHCDTLPDENLSFTLVRSVPCSCLVLGCICFMLAVIRYVIRKRLISFH